MSSGKVLLINANQMKPVVAPIALDYIGHALKKSGNSVQLLDLSFSEDINGDTSTCLKHNSPHVIGITVRNVDDCYYLSQDFFLPSIRDLIKKIREYTNSPVVLGGVGFSVMPREVVEYSGADFGIIGEGEFSFPELVEKIVANENYTEIPGLIYRSGNSIICNPQKPGHLDLLSDCRRDTVDNERYYREGGMAGIETKRGCAEHCIYCPEPAIKGRRYRLRQPEHIVYEIQSLCQKEIYHFHTCDSEFNLPEEHAKAVCREIIESGLGNKISWYAYATPKPFSEELLSLMKESGCVGIDFGVDSGCNAILKSLGRRHNKEDLRTLGSLCYKYDMTFMYDLLLGSPGETKETIKETIDLMKEIQPSRVGVSMGVRIYPQTSLANIVQNEGISRENQNLYGNIEGNESFLKPIFYISSSIGEDIHSYTSSIIGKDERFFIGSQEEDAENYNYNDNSILVDAIRGGARGAFWSILLNMSEK